MTEIQPAAGLTVLDRLRGALVVLAATPRIVQLVWRAHPRYATAALALNVLRGLNPLVQAWLIKLTMDAIAAVVTQEADPLAAAGPVFALALLRCGVQALDAALWPVASFAWVQLSDHVTRALHDLIMSKANSFRGIAFFESPRFFDLLQRAQSQATSRPTILLTSLTSLIRSVLGLVSMTAVFFAFSPWLAVLIVVATYPQLVRQFKNRREAWEINNYSVPEVRTMGYMTNLLTWKEAAKEVRLFGLGEYFTRIFRETFDSFTRRHSAMRRRHWYSSLALSLLAAGANALGYGALIFAVVEGRITLGDFALLYSALNQMRDGLSGAIWQAAGVYESNLYMSNLFELEAVEEPLVVAPPERAARVPVPLRRGVELRGVEFSYPGREKPVLEDVSFTIAPGQTVALVGENGAGKTTLVKLLTRLYDPTGGSVLVDGVDLRTLDLDEWRRRIAVVLQDFVEYAMPARENIGVGWLPSIEDTAAVRTAAERAGADSLIARLPEGYETMLGRQFRSIGTDGVSLSGGEWQRIALARAFIRDEAQLLILDEPTSALDARAEHDLFLRFKTLTEGRATLLISHRFSTVRMADEIIVLDGGRIVERGSHDALTATGGHYARLYALQAERYV